MGNSGEPGGTRTRDPVLKRHMLYHLSYRPCYCGNAKRYLFSLSDRGYTWSRQPMNRLARRFLFLGLAIAATLLIGTVGFALIDGYPPFDAFYMTLITMTTVGYSEIHPLSQAGRVFNSFLIFFGVTTIFIAMGAMTQTIIELEFGHVIGKRRTKRMIDKLKDHYIICGYGRVGRGAAAELQHSRVPFVVVDISQERVERAAAAGLAPGACYPQKQNPGGGGGRAPPRGAGRALPPRRAPLFSPPPPKAPHP